jgi:hypothetical protein
MIYFHLPKGSLSSSSVDMDRDFKLVKVCRQAAPLQREAIFVAVLACRTCWFFRAALFSSLSGLSLIALSFSSSWVPFSHLLCLEEFTKTA